MVDDAAAAAAGAAVKQPDPEEVVRRIEDRGRRPWMARVTRPREHVRPGGEREFILDRVDAQGENLDQLELAVAGFLELGIAFHFAESYVEDKTNLTKWHPRDRAMREEDVRAATLVLHEEFGDRAGTLLDLPYVRLVTGESRKYQLDLEGQPRGACRICRLPHEPLEELNVPGAEAKLVHPGCWKVELRKLQRKASEDLQQQLAERL